MRKLNIDVRFWQSRLKVVKNHKRLEKENEQDMQDKDMLKAQGIVRDVHWAQWYQKTAMYGLISSLLLAVSSHYFTLTETTCDSNTCTWFYEMTIKNKYVPCYLYYKTQSLYQVSIASTWNRTRGRILRQWWISSQLFSYCYFDIPTTKGPLQTLVLN